MTTLYCTEPGTQVRVHQGSLVIERGHQQSRVRLTELEVVVIFPGIQVTSAVLTELLDRGIETLFLRQDGGFRGRLQGQMASNPTIRLAQYQHLETAWGLTWAKQIVVGKVANQRVLLQRRNRASHGRITALAESIDIMAAYGQTLKNDPAPTRESLMGMEGICARTYYQGLQHYFPPHWGFAGRTRQPPQDPINALLSWGYGVLLSRVFSACVMAGLDPYLGFLHANLPYRPNLVLDLMEEFRPVGVDLTVIQVIDAGVLSPEDFQPSPDGDGVWLGPLAKKVYLAALEKRFREPLLYPPQSRRLSLQQIFVEQARCLGRCLVKSSFDYQPLQIR